MKVLVTGDDGLLGRRLTEALVGRGHRVARLGADGGERAATVRGSIEDAVRAFNEYETEVCYHVGAGAGKRGPVGTFESEIRGAWHVLEAARLHRPLRRLVFASSDRVYGEQETWPATEDTPFREASPADASKSCADLLAQSYLKTYRLPVAIARCSTLYGGGDPDPDGFIPRAIRSAIKGRRPGVRPGRIRHDYLYIEDAVSAFLALGGSGETGPFNIATGTTASDAEVVRQILSLMKSKLRPPSPDRASDPRLSCAKARKRLKWTPRYDLKRGLAKTIAAARRNFKALLPPNRRHFRRGSGSKSMPPKAVGRGSADQDAP